MTRRNKLLLGIAVLAAIGGAALLHGGSAAPEGPPPQIAALPGVAPDQGVGALGHIEPASRILKLTHAAGAFGGVRIARLLVDEGDRVEAGALLAEFSDAALKDATLAQAEADLAQRRASLARIRAAGRPEDIAAQRAQIAALSAAEEIAKRDAERAERLVPSGAGGIAAAERQRFAATRAAAERAEAEATLQRMLTARPEDVTVAEAELAGAEAAVAKARADAALSRLRAPIAGTVLRIVSRTGERIGDDGVMEIGDLSHLDVVADVYETDLPRIRLGAPAEILIPGESRRFAATVREIGWQVRRAPQAATDPIAAVDARTVAVRLALDATARQALERRSNMQVQVAIRP
ncbi:MAG TPA: efflux RND transporter periplasmic adaptor subunit [Roseomonas sp.]|jgi:HlyD family secretion protein